MTYWDPLPTVALLDAGSLFLGTWPQRDWRNVPGPFYGAETDNCWTGRLHAPDLVLYDDGYGSEFVYRQPRDELETCDLLEAVLADPFGGYAMDGDQHWAPADVTAWWRDRQRIIEWTVKAAAVWRISERPEEREVVDGLTAYGASFDSGALLEHLRQYTFWLEHGRPARDGERLPEL
ncbi:ferredoxin [Dactylosporangium sp. NPDC049525]|uniref:ferredoxin n=1 Tax=Dactylosporangium sp. NPDC049525 TaxID=3154730 RepID=UPI0034314DE4